MENNKKHWRDVYDSEFLASWDLDGNVKLTIDYAAEEMCKLAKGKEKKLVLHFAEKELPTGVKVKPMICIPTNCKTIQLRTGMGQFADWKGIRVEIGIGENKGGIGNSVGLRIVNVLTDVDIEYILQSNDLKFVREEATKLKRSMTDEQKESCKNHINQLETNGIQG